MVFAAVVTVTGCSGEPAPGYARSALPRTCDTARFGTAAASFEGIAARRDEILARLDAMRMDEPAHYLGELEREKAAMEALLADSQKVEVPRCLARAREIFGRYLEATVANMDLRKPAVDPAAYRYAREATDGIRTQFETELRNQERNKQ